MCIRDSACPTSRHSAVQVMHQRAAQMAEHKPQHGLQYPLSSWCHRERSSYRISTSRAAALASKMCIRDSNRESGGKRFSGRVRKANRYVKRALCQSAWAASHTKATYLAAFYRRMCVRQGSPKAILARAHHMIKVIYQVLSRNEKYVELGGDYYDQRNRPRMVAHLVKRLSRLGYVVELRETPPHIAGITSAQPTTESEPADEVPKAASTGRKRGLSLIHI